jgi:hypothetical protein
VRTIAGDRLAVLTRRPELIPGLLGVGVFIALACSEGGYDVTSWAPAGLFLLVLLAIATFVYRDRFGELEPANRIAVLFLAGFVAWNFASIAWADVQGTAWDGANRALVYLIVYSLFSVVAWRVGTVGFILGLYSLGLAVAGAVVLIDASGSSDAALSLISGRLAEPTGYPNAVAALFVGGFWPAIYLASRRETPWPVRGLMLATAGFLIQIALMAQSRGSLIVLPIALLIYLLLVPNRIRALLAVALVAAGSALAVSPILDVFEVNDAGGNVGAAIAEAGNAMLLSCCVLLVVGIAVALADRRITIAERTQRAAGRIGWALAAVAAVVGIVVAIGVIGNPVDWGNQRWEDFKGDYDQGGFGSSRFSGDLGSGRYDFWRVALDDEISEAPLVGDGSDNFAVTYLQHRQTGEEPFYPHSLPIRILAGTGIVGALLFAGFAIAAIVAAFRSRIRAGTAFGRGIAAVALSTMGYFALHSSGDWLWTFAAITMPVFAWMGLAAGLAGRGTEVARSFEGREGQGGQDGRGGRRRALRLALVAVALIAAVVAFASLALPWTAARYIDSAASGWPSDPEAAASHLDTARDLNPLTARADLVAGTIAVRSDDEREAEAAFARATEREPTNWYARLELGALDVLAGDRERGTAQLKRAQALNPDEPLIAAALRGVRGGKPLTPQQIDRALIERVCNRVGLTQGTRYCKN